MTRTTPPTSGDLDSGLKPTATEPPVIKVDDSNSNSNSNGNGSNTDTTPTPAPTTDQSGTSTAP
jgi:hypothetical protein